MHKFSFLIVALLGVVFFLVAPSAVEARGMKKKVFQARVQVYTPGEDTQVQVRIFAPGKFKHGLDYDIAVQIGPTCRSNCWWSGGINPSYVHLGELYWQECARSMCTLYFRGQIPRRNIEEIVIPVTTSTTAGEWPQGVIITGLIGDHEIYQEVTVTTK